MMPLTKGVIPDHLPLMVMKCGHSQFIFVHERTLGLLRISGSSITARQSRSSVAIDVNSLEIAANWRARCNLEIKQFARKF